MFSLSLLFGDLVSIIYIAVELRRRCAQPVACRHVSCYEWLWFVHVGDRQYMMEARVSDF